MAAAEGRDPAGEPALGGADTLPVHALAPDEQPRAPDGEELDARAIREAARAKLFGAARARPVKIDRYLVQREIGAGGMGEVFAAFDPELGRKVAIKLVHRALGGSDPDANARLLREARALAQLDHPSIVPIHDVGTSGDRIWLAMEYIHGETLRAWLRTDRRRGAILDVLVRAGRGLAAAHERGILHRDFKPDNVMVAPAGAERPLHVRVTDFGLAAWIDRDEQPPAPQMPSGDEPVDVVTRSNAILGTIGYIAPEQLAGERPSEASDQFAFCVTAHEALCGTRPFVGKTPLEVAGNTLAGRTTTALRDTLPRWIRTVLERGMARQPAARFSTMAELLDALERDPAARRRRFLAAGGLVVVSGAVAMASSSRGPSCVRDESRLADVWDEPTQRAVHDALVATQMPYAEDAWKNIEPIVGGYANAWLDARHDACAATHERGEQSAELLDLRVACLDDRLQGLRELTRVLRDADETVARHAVKAVGELARIEPCADAIALRSTMPPLDDPALAQEVAAAQIEIAGVRANSATGRYATALELGAVARAHATSTGHRPTLAEAFLELGLLGMRVDDPVAAESDLRAAVREGQASHHDRAAARAAAILVAIVGYRLSRPERGEEWSEEALALLDRMGGDDVIEAIRLTNLGLLRDGQGRIPEARELHARALELRRAALGDDHQAVADSLVNLGADALVSGDLSEAATRLREAADTYERTLGPHHPDVGGVFANLAVVAFERKDYVEAIAGNERALAVLEPALGSEHREVLAAGSNLAHALGRAGRLDEAVATARRVTTAALRAYDRDHAEPARIQRVLAEVLLRRGDHGAARDELTAAVERLVRIGDPTAAEAMIEPAHLTPRADAHAASRRTRFARLRARDLETSLLARFGRPRARAGMCCAHRDRARARAW